ncbi:WhiB family transcriptional regulator [Kineococcus sp. SYSU DK005]|uniref:WhiB family transcriptional regulator n=1 Tax=Kineococcus sp. SYSU DK005 TaxID=3383126 RepID=UPI003D7DB26A
MVWTLEWASRGACKSATADDLFVQGSAQNRAKTICGGCPVRTECLADALDSRVEFGVWGGMTERERRALLKRRPNVGSWRRLLEAARDAHLATAAGSLTGSGTSAPGGTGAGVDEDVLHAV